MKSIMAYKTDGWFFRKYKKNLKMFSGISKEQFEAAKEKHFERWTRANREELHQRDKYRRRREIIRYFAEIPYEYEGDGLDDYNKYQRPCSDGIGYVSVCPGERANNFYVDDPNLSLQQRKTTLKGINMLERIKQQLMKNDN